MTTPPVQMLPTVVIRQMPRAEIPGAAMAVAAGVTDTV